MEKTYLASDVCRITGVERRTIQTWVDGGFLSPSVEKAEGPGTRNRWSEDDLVAIKIFSHLLTKGFSREAASNIVGSSQRMFSIDSADEVKEMKGKRDMSFFFSYTVGIPTYAVLASSKSGSINANFVICTLLPILKALESVILYMNLEDVESLVVERVDSLVSKVYSAL